VNKASPHPNEGPLFKALSSILLSRDMQLDEAQCHAVHALQGFYQRWIHFRKRQSFITWFKRTPVPKGIYLWGGVGRGKSFLMDAFFEAVPETKKARWHFHAFMRRIHAMSAQYKHQPDPLIHIAKIMAQETRLLCFDEFHISDIADAMILGRLFEHLLQHGVGFVLTSNYPPEDLYPNGLQRQNFLPTIALLKAHLDVIQVDGNIDYRHRTLTSATLYYAPLTPGTHEQLNENFHRLNGALSWSSTPLLINDRPINVLASGEHIAWFDFEALCGTPRSQHDYLAITEQFDTLIISNIPALKSDQSAEAIRFKWLIDILYDHRVKLMLSALVPVTSICPLDTPNSEFARTLSRLTEMQSDDYLHEAKRPVLAAEQGSDSKDNIRLPAIPAKLASA